MRLYVFSPVVGIIKLYVFVILMSVKWLLVTLNLFLNCLWSWASFHVNYPLMISSTEVIYLYFTNPSFLLSDLWNFWTNVLNYCQWKSLLPICSFSSLLNFFFFHSKTSLSVTWEFKIYSFTCWLFWIYYAYLSFKRSYFYLLYIENLSNLLYEWWYILKYFKL